VILELSTQALLLAVAGLIAVAVAEWSGSRDNGGMWSRAVMLVFALVLLPALVLNVADSESPAVGAWLGRYPSFLQLVVPMGLWAAMVLLSRAFPESPEASRWIAGTTGFELSRVWVLVTLAPLLPLLVFGWSRLSGSRDGFPLYAWMAAVAFCLTGIGVALSGRRESALNAAPARAGGSARAALEDWPTGMGRHGVPVKRVQVWNAAEPAPVVQAEDPAHRWRRLLEHAGARNVPWPMLRAVFHLIGARDVRSRNVAALAVAPDAHGQTELTALAAVETAMFRGGSTLIVTRDPSPELCAQLQAWTARLQRHLRGPRLSITLVRPDTQADTLFGRPGIWVTDVSSLSDVVLDRLRQDDAAPASIDLLVWWNVHECSGVVGTELWAVSRRLARIMDSTRPVPAAVLAFARSSSRDERLQLFVTQLLPATFSMEAPYRADVAPQPRRRLHVYTPGSRSQTSALLRGVEDETMQAATASALTGWPTRPHRPPMLTDAEWETYLDATVDGRPIREVLPEDVAHALAHVRRFEESSAMAVQATLSGIGRADSDGSDGHVLLVPGENPYLSYLLGEMPQGGNWQRGRRLISAEGHPHTGRRHLLLALRERRDTRYGLTKRFGWDEAATDAVLKELESQQLIDMEPVRYLTRDDAPGSARGWRLERDFEYFNRQPGQVSISDFDLVTLRDKDRDDTDSVLRRILAGRAGIEAYPRAVFFARGRRYRVNEYSDLRETIRKGWLQCMIAEEEAVTTTHRVRLPTLSAPRRGGDPFEVEGRHGAVTRQLWQVRYHEELSGVLEMTAAGPQRTRFAPMQGAQFDTRALLLHFDNRPSDEALSTIAAALRHVLPVYVAVESNAVEVMAIPRVWRSDELRGALALVELHPGGLGLLDAIEEDERLLRFLLAETADWLDWLQTHGGVGVLEQSPATATVKGQADLSLPAALEVLLPFRAKAAPAEF
jgi:hypothetical protein